MGVIRVDTRSRTPIYEQLIENIRANVLRGDIKAGEQLPSVRSLAGELCINPNTIQRAYNELERSGFIVSVPGRGSFISDDLSGILAQSKNTVIETLRENLSKAKSSNIPKNEVLDLVNKIWEEDT